MEAVYRQFLFFYTGTGKTATFSISILQQIDTSNHECQALILAPTRELAQQVFGNTSSEISYFFIRIFFSSWQVRAICMQDSEFWVVKPFMQVLQLSVAVSGRRWKCSHTFELIGGLMWAFGA
jgi:hypothetical protein